MVTREDIFQFLREMGIQPTDTVMVHTSLRAIGPLDGGADALIDAFSAYLKEGLLLIPTHTWDNVTSAQPWYDVRETEPCIGTLPRIAAKRADGVRSLHPTHSVMAFGKDAAAYVKGEERAASPAPVGGCWARLYDVGAKILLIGVGHASNTYFHAVDEILDIPNRLNPKSFVIQIRNAEGRIMHSPPFHTHLTQGAPCCCSEFYPNYEKPLERLGAVTYGQLGNAKVYCCDAVRCADAIRLLWSRTDHDLCIREEEIPRSYYADQL